MNRRATLRCLALALSAAVLRGTAAQARPRRVVLVLGGDEPHGGAFVDGFRKGLRDAGWLEPGRIELVTRFSDGDARRNTELIRQAVAERPDVLVVAGLHGALQARAATTTIPIVVATGSNLVDAGVVQSFARPGGNITGVSDLVDEVAVKRLELVRAALPHAKRVALLTSPDFPATPRIESRIDAAAPRLGLEIVKVQVADRSALLRALDGMPALHVDAVLPGGAPMFNSPELIERATAARVPVVHYWQGTAQQGALVSYEVDVRENFRLAAGYVDRILKGARPADLPIHQPSHYRLVVNERVAGELGLTLPAALLQRADEVVR
jgi:putative ABC transport system substrate-binding protein